MLRLERVSKFYSSAGVVSTGFSKVDLSFEIGEFVAITGESGSGKSTLLNVISGLDAYEEGEMYINGQPTSGYTGEEMETYRKQYIGNIFQTFNLINSYTVYQNVELVLLMSGYERSVIPGKVREIIAQVGLAGYEKTKASKLSGGQKQRVAIARALAKETPIIVADEPTGNLDSQSAAEIIRLLAELSHDKLVILVTHNYDQVAPYVTRKITMHDGRVVEDKRLAAAPVPPAASPVQTARADSLRFGSMCRLGVRNTFNIPAKFFLLLIVFLFLCGGVAAQYTAFQNLRDEQAGGYNFYFNDTDADRIIVTRQDKKELTDEDYAMLESIENVRQVVKNDLMLDTIVTLTDSREGMGNYYIESHVEELQEDQTFALQEGRMPENGRELVLLIPRQGYAQDVISQVADVADKRVFLLDQYDGTPILDHRLRIVGWGYMSDAQEKALQNSSIYYDALAYLPAQSLSDIRRGSLVHACSQEILFQDKILDTNSGEGMMPLVASDQVPEGEIYIGEDVASLCPYDISWAVGEDLLLTNKSQYFSDQFHFTVGAVYTEYTYSYWLDRDDFDRMAGALFLNPKDYAKIFDKGNFQSSVRVTDDRLVADTAEQIRAAGYDTLVMRDALADYTGGFGVILDTVYILILAALLVVLFFITYFIVKLILKSRNVYFSTIRMLGATRHNCGSLLRVELFVVFNLAFALCLGVLLLFKRGVIPSDYVQDLLFYLSPQHVILLYAVLCLMSLLLAIRYARQLFRKTAMNAYKEEV